MSDSIYTAVLDNGENMESIQLEFVDGKPQPSLVRTADQDGVEVEVTYEIDPDAIGFVYRPVSIDESGDR